MPSVKSFNESAAEVLAIEPSAATRDSELKYRRMMRWAAFGLRDCPDRLGSGRVDRRCPNLTRGIHDLYRGLPARAMGGQEMHGQADCSGAERFRALKPQHGRLLDRGRIAALDKACLLHCRRKELVVRGWPRRLPFDHVRPGKGASAAGFGSADQAIPFGVQANMAAASFRHRPDRRGDRLRPAKRILRACRSQAGARSAMI